MTLLPPCRGFSTPTTATRMGSPSVAGSMMLRRSSISVASRLYRGRRPPPLRRSRPFGRGVESRSFTPRPMVERASPVISDRPPDRPSHRPDIAGGEHPSPALIELRTDGFPSLPNRREEIGIQADAGDIEILSRFGQALSVAATRISSNTRSFGASSLFNLQ